MSRTVSSQWQATIIVCGKCSKKLGGGFGVKGRTPLAKALRALGDGKKGRKSNLGVVETGCLKLCPKGAVVVMNAAQPQTWLLAKPSEDVDDIARQLGLDTLHPSGDRSGEIPERSKG